MKKSSLPTESVAPRVLPGPCCPPKAKPEERPLLSTAQAASLSELFKILANDTRLRLLHALVRAGELRVTALAQGLSMTLQAVSNHLQRLSDAGIVSSRREGKHIAYRLVDPCVRTLLDQGLCLAEDACRRARFQVSRGGLETNSRL